MKLKNIIIQHLITSGICLILFFLFSLFVKNMNQVQHVFYLSLAAFCLFSFSVCFFASQLAGHKNKSMFNSIILLSSLFKIGITIVLILATKVEHKDFNVAYLIAFLLTYISFTILETAILQRLAKQSNKIWKQTT